MTDLNGSSDWATLFDSHFLRQFLQHLPVNLALVVLSLTSLYFILISPFNDLSEALYTKMRGNEQLFQNSSFFLSSL
jgi:hypothetical protein